MKYVKHVFTFLIFVTKTKLKNKFVLIILIFIIKYYQNNSKQSNNDKILWTLLKEVKD